MACLVTKQTAMSSYPSIDKKIYQVDNYSDSSCNGTNWCDNVTYKKMKIKRTAEEKGAVSALELLPT